MRAMPKEDRQEQHKNLLSASRMLAPIMKETADRSTRAGIKGAA